MNWVCKKIQTSLRDSKIPQTAISWRSWKVSEMLFFSEEMFQSTQIRWKCSSAATYAYQRCDAIECKSKSFSPGAPAKMYLTSATDFYFSNHVHCAEGYHIWNIFFLEEVIPLLPLHKSRILLVALKDAIINSLGKNQNLFTHYFNSD